LFYCALSSRTLYSVSVDALANRRVPDAAVAATIRNLGHKGMSDGLETDRRDRVYGGDIEHDALIRRLPDGRIQTVVRGSQILWIDTLSRGADGYMYFTVNQLDRLPLFHKGVDLRKKPYVLYRVRIDH
jgi:sugar lactone lactonase YvrE